MPAEPFTLSALAVLLFINGVKAIMSIAKRFRRSSCTGSNGEHIEIDLTGAEHVSRPASEREQSTSPQPQRSRSHSRGRRRSRDSSDDPPTPSRSKSR